MPGMPLSTGFFLCGTGGAIRPAFSGCGGFLLCSSKGEIRKKRRISDGCRSGFRATSRFFPARSCAERSFALSLTAHECPVVGFHALFCPSHKVISGYVEFQGEILFIVKDPWPVDRGRYRFMTYEQIVSELEDNQSLGNTKKSIWDSCIVVSTSYANETVPVRIN